MVKVSVDGFMDFVQVFNFAIFWFKDENLFFFDKLLFFFFKGSNTEVAQVFLDVDTFPVFVKRDLS